MEADKPPAIRLEASGVMDYRLMLPVDAGSDCGEDERESADDHAEEVFVGSGIHWMYGCMG